MEGLETYRSVSKWLKGLDRAFEKYVPDFEKNLVDGFWLLNHVTTESLVKYGVDKREHQEKILNEIRKIQNNINMQRLKNRK